MHRNTIILMMMMMTGMSMIQIITGKQMYLQTQEH